MKLGKFYFMTIFFLMASYSPAATKYYQQEEEAIKSKAQPHPNAPNIVQDQTVTTQVDPNCTFRKGHPCPKVTVAHYSTVRYDKDNKEEKRTSLGWIRLK